MVNVSDDAEIGEYHVNDTVIIVRRFFDGTKTVKETIMDNISMKKLYTN